jgi:hypothetical protein
MCELGMGGLHNSFEVREGLSIQFHFVLVSQRVVYFEVQLDRRIILEVDRLLVSLAYANKRLLG